MRDVPYTKSFCVVVDGRRHESSLEDGTSEILRLKAISNKRLMYQIIL